MQLRPFCPTDRNYCYQLLGVDVLSFPKASCCFVLEKDGTPIGTGAFTPSHSETDFFQILFLAIDPLWRKKGYGSYLLRQLLHKMGAYQKANASIFLSQDNIAAHALVKKFGFQPSPNYCNDDASAVEWVRFCPKPFTSLSLAHSLIAARLCPGSFAVDATAGRGRDTAYLCRLVGETGKVLAMDIQPEAVEATNQLLEQQGLSSIGKAVLADHAQLGQMVSPSSVDCVVFNFGWLPGADHSIFTTPKTSLPALEAALTALKPNGFLVASIYHGGINGTQEKDTLPLWFASLDSKKYGVVQCNFVNRQGKDPLVFLVQCQ